VAIPPLQESALFDCKGADIVEANEIGIVVNTKARRITLEVKVGLLDAPVRLYPLLQALLALLAAVASSEQQIDFYFGPFGQCISSGIRIRGTAKAPIHLSMGHVLQAALK